MAYLTTDEVKAISDAALRDIATGNTWEEIKDLTLADLCSANQDALIDDIFEDDARDRELQAGMVGHVDIYDTLLGTHRIAEVLKAEIKRTANVPFTRQPYVLRLQLHVMTVTDSALNQITNLSDTELVGWAVKHNKALQAEDSYTIGLVSRLVVEKVTEATA